MLKSEELEALLVKVESTRDSLQEATAQAVDLGDRITAATKRVVASWSGSWIGYHSHLYYRDFAEPDWEHRFDPEWGLLNRLSLEGEQRGWRIRTLEEVTGQIETASGVTAKEIESLTQKMPTELDNVKLEIAIVLAPIRGLLGFQKETDLLEELEGFTWVLPPEEIIEAAKPTEVRTRDYKAVAQGIGNPPHLRYFARCASAAQPAREAVRFFPKALRLIRQILERIRRDTGHEGKKASAEIVEQVLSIFRRLPLAVSQLNRRHAGRQPFEIRDEHDLQDLLAAILRAAFDDVRAEEGTPSVAAGAARIDFLLKVEEIAVEVKMTRDKLGARKVAEELFIDIARYQGHPDCKVLVCLVYDPEQRIENPTGFVRDIESKSSAALEVRVVVAR